MTVLPNFTTFRATFALDPLVAAGSFIFSDSNPDTIIWQSGDFGVLGVVNRNIVTVAGSGINDGVYYSEVVAGNVMTLIASDALTNQGPVPGVTATIQPIDADGLETWPVQNVLHAPPMRGIPRYHNLGATMFVTVNNYAADVVAGVNEYDWHVSQRTDMASDQHLLVSQKPDLGGNSFSGAIFISLNSTTDFPTGTLDEMTPDALKRIAKHVVIYAQRRSDKAIFWADLTRRWFTNA